PDVGGGFGTRGPVYNEYLAVAHACHHLGRAVRYTATRSEDLIASRAARDVVADAEVAADENGRILATRARVLLNLGAYADVPGPPPGPLRPGTREGARHPRLRRRPGPSGRGPPRWLAEARRHRHGQLR